MAERRIKVSVGIDGYKQGVLANSRRLNCFGIDVLRRVLVEVV